MSAREEWGAWIEHDGKGCPVIGHIVECRWLQSDGAVRLRNYKGQEAFPAAGSGSWYWSVVKGRPTCPTRHRPIIRYRIRRPRALTELVELVENLPAPSRPTEVPA